MLCAGYPYAVDPIKKEVRRYKNATRFAKPDVGNDFELARGLIAKSTRVLESGLIPMNMRDTFIPASGHSFVIDPITEEVYEYGSAFPGDSWVTYDQATAALDYGNGCEIDAGFDPATPDTSYEAYTSTGMWYTTIYGAGPLFKPSNGGPVLDLSAGVTCTITDILVYTK